MFGCARRKKGIVDAATGGAACRGVSNRRALVPAFRVNGAQGKRDDLMGDVSYVRTPY